MTKSKYAKKEKDLPMSGEEDEISDSETETEVEETDEEEESETELERKSRKNGKRSIAITSGSESDTNGESTAASAVKQKMKGKTAPKKVATKKRKLESSKKVNAKKMKEEEKIVSSTSSDSGVETKEGKGEQQYETKHPDIDSVVDEKDEKKRGGKKEAKKFNDRNCDYNLFENDPCNVIQKKCKLSNSLNMVCKMVDAADGKSGQTYEYASLVFEKKSRNDSVFEFGIPLSLAPTIIRGLQLMMDDNPKFFSKYQMLQGN